MENLPPTTHRISEFNQWWHDKRLDLNPKYQRNPVWSDRNKSYLIDTVLNELPVPEIYMQVKTDPQGNTKYEVVDGQQRLRAILGFIQGHYAILEEESVNFGGKKFENLPDGYKQKFWNYQLVVRELRTNSEDEIRGIFRRLNKNVVPLNGQEIRHATYTGYFMQLSDQLADDTFWTENKIVTRNDVNRMLDVEFVSELLIALLHGVQAKDTDMIDGYYKMYDVTFTERDDTKRDFNSTKNKIEEILGDLRQTRWHFKSEFYSLFVSLQNLMKDYTIPPERYGEMRELLCKFSAEADTVYQAEDKADSLDIPKGSGYTKSQVVDFVDSVSKQSANREPRTKRTRIVKELLIPFLIARDPKRDFNDDERRIAWSLAEDKKCAICHKEVVWDEYHLDHKVPHNKGGKTELRNAQITHKKCNQSKGKK